MQLNYKDFDEKELFRSLFTTFFFSFLVWISNITLNPYNDHGVFFAQQ